MTHSLCNVTLNTRPYFCFLGGSGDETRGNALHPLAHFPDLFINISALYARIVVVSDFIWFFVLVKPVLYLWCNGSLMGNIWECDHESKETWACNETELTLFTADTIVPLCAIAGTINHITGSIVLAGTLSSTPETKSSIRTFCETKSNL